MEKQKPSMLNIIKSAFDTYTDLDAPAITLDPDTKQEAIAVFTSHGYDEFQIIRALEMPNLSLAVICAFDSEGLNEYFNLMDEDPRMDRGV